MTGKLKYILILNLFFFIFNFKAQSEIFKKNFEIKLDKHIEVQFDRKNLKKYYKYLSNISNRDKIFLEDKKNFNVVIFYKGKKIKASAKIASHSVDHVDFRRGFSSLVIKLKDGHIENMTRFRLLKLVSKGYEDEIFWSTLLEQMNYPTPHASIVNVKFNQENYPMIFQEKVAKEFLERWSIKDSPIIEGNYNQFKELQGDCVKNKISVTLCYKKFINSLFYSSKIDNQKFIKGFNSALISFKGIVSNNYYNYENFYNINIDYAAHGLSHKNSKFVYDPIYNFKIPIYYDGDVNLKKNFNKKCKKKSSFNINFKKNDKESYFNKLYEYRAGLKLNSIQKCIAEEFLKSENLFFKKPNFEDINLSYNFERNLPFKGFYNDTKINKNQFNFKQNFLSFDSKEYKFKFCQKLNTQTKICNIVDDLKKYKKILGASVKPNANKIYDIVYYDSKKNLDKIKKRKIIFSDKKIFYEIPENSLSYIRVKSNVELIKLNFLNSKNSKVVFIGQLPEKLKLFANDKSITRNLNNFTRLDENNLTGCITFLDTKFNLLDLNISNLKCEDSINFIRSFGSIEKLWIFNASSDALDMDFSNILIKEIKIKKAGNDCVDVSYGSYQVLSADLDFCKDKAISVGEKSFFTGVNLSIRHSNIGVATKDSSVTKIDNIYTKKTKNCLSAYKKKQEFDGAEIYINNLKGCKLFYMDNFSKIFTSQR